jgi:hypothetical protein
MFFNNYRADSFIDLLNKRVDDLSYKIVLTLDHINVILKYLKDGGIPIQSGDGSSSSVPNYSTEMAVLQQVVGNIPVPNSLTPTITLSEFISYALTADVIAAAKKVPPSFITTTLQQMYKNINSLMSGDGGGGCGSSGVNYSGEIEALQAVAAKIPGFFTTSTLHGIYDDVVAIKDKVYTLPMLPNPLEETLTWVDVISAVSMIPELQQTVTNIISQLNSQSLINLQTLQAALDQADGSLETISVKLQQTQ